jgi:hypothetical protein
MEEQKMRDRFKGLLWLCSGSLVVDSAATAIDPQESTKNKISPFWFRLFAPPTGL